MSTKNCEKQPETIINQLQPSFGFKETLLKNKNIHLFISNEYLSDRCEIIRLLDQKYAKNYVLFSFLDSSEIDLNIKKPENEYHHQIFPFSIQIAFSIANVAYRSKKDSPGISIIFQSSADFEIYTLFYMAAVAHILELSSNIVDTYNDLLSAHIADKAPEYQNGLMMAQNIDQIATITDCKSMKLHQIIIVCFLSGPTVLEISTPNNEHHEISKCYKDLSFVVFNNINLDVCGDINIRFSLLESGRKKLLYSVSLNTYFYRQGIYRFTKENSLFFSELISTDFFLDIIFDEGQADIKIPYKIKKEEDDISNEGSRVGNVGTENSIHADEIISKIKNQLKEAPPAKKTATFGRFSSRGRAKEEINPSKLLSVRPLYWAVLDPVQNTIFSENASVEVDYEKFEKNFCTLKSESNNGFKVTDACGAADTVCDPRRLFLVSLSLRHLELKSINLKNLENTLLKNSSVLTVEDLLNLQKIFPSGKELSGFKAKCKGQLDRIEQEMVEWGNRHDLLKLVEIEIVNRRFQEEIPRLRKHLELYKCVFTKMIASEELKRVFRLLLEIGNAIQYKYAYKRRMVAPGFKLESLPFYYTYRGATGMPLMSFVKDMMVLNRIDIGKLESDFQGIDKIDTLSRMRERIDELVTLQGNVVDAYRTAKKESLKDSHRTIYRKIIDQGNRTLEPMSERYKDICVLEQRIRAVFGIDDHQATEFVFNSLSELISNFRACDGQSSKPNVYT